MAAVIEIECSRSTTYNVKKVTLILIGIYDIIFCSDYTIIYNEKYISDRSFFLYSPYPNLEGIKDVLCYKFRRHTIDQNCSAMWTIKGGHRDAFLKK